jgi:hypothetical protein
MDDELRAVKAALADISDNELQALIDATRDGTQTAQNLLAWIEAACEWERNRRTGRDSELQPLETGTTPEEDAVSIDAAITLRGLCSRGESEAPGGVFALFDALVALLTGGERKH